MQLGFVSAILPDQSLDEVLQTAADIGYDCVEVMCWPPGKAERRYAGVTHIDISRLDRAEIDRIKELQERHGVFISSLGYYPNVLGADAGAAQVAIDHLYDLLQAAADLGIHTVTTFVGRDKDRTVEAQWGDFLAVWRPIVARANELGVRIGIENCPMRFTADEWPGGNNLAVSPEIWERMWRDIPSANWGLNYDPSHLVLMHMDYTRPFRDYPDRMIHVHAKDLRIDRDRLDRHGIFSHPGQWHTPKLPGLGDVDWGKFFSHLTDAGYRGPVCVEVEDRAYEGDLELRKRSLRQSHDYLRQFVV
ncbi:sugar phosphate isomerase/epimerase [Lewinella sp. JB7]|uniref:sugar phosphate isomerase/epimerase family protein n=1 Tax=Lewinella sp. JB7 TaxID=2962887 RepID=UPI0020C9B24E|nr:sugar phosphate isomerase/epimerase family protein [Lewinella sp. JB7]MCP9234896.1 sugar phosphate isomerase/epimerase [Lewinella sp. JB7]